LKHLSEKKTKGKLKKISYETPQQSLIFLTTLPPGYSNLA